jgi:signal transduction histidine kinase
MSNVLINALQARREGQQAIVDISLIKNADAVLIEIRDNGRGVPASLQERIFQPQFTTKESGSGLGLYMTHQFVVQSGGRIWFTTSDHGTTFYIELPLLPA